MNSKLIKYYILSFFSLLLPLVMAYYWKPNVHSGEILLFILAPLLYLFAPFYLIKVILHSKKEENKRSLIISSLLFLSWMCFTTWLCLNIWGLISMVGLT